MKKLIQKSRKVENLPTRCRGQLNGYALAAAAAGVGMAALALPSEAKIIYTPTHRVIGDGDSYKLDFNGQGTTNLTLQNEYRHWTTSCGGTFASQALAAVMPGKNEVVYNVFGAAAMKEGAEIGHHCEFHGSKEGMAVLDGGSSGFGSWINVKNRYLGVKFKIKGATHYGWARLSVQIQFPLTITGTLTGYAYESAANKPIVAGKTTGPDVVTVEPGTLGTLALGRK